MKPIYPFVDDHPMQQDQHSATFKSFDPDPGEKTVNGWITEDGTVFFTENTPQFNPYTGEKVEVVNE